MSISVLFRSVSRIRRTIVVTIGILLVAPIVSAGPQLWLYPDENGPRQGGHILPLKDFTLVVENRAKASEENVAQETVLVVAVNDPRLIGTLGLAEYGVGEPIALKEWVEGTPELPCSHKPMSRHGVYPAFFAVSDPFDLEGGQRFKIDVTVDGEADLRVHFDAMAIAWKTTGKGPKCSDVSNPAGHDVTLGQKPGGHDDCGHVKIRKSADQKYVDFGDTVTFEIEVFNEGSCDLTDPVLRDFFPTVEDENGDSVPAFSVSGGTDPSPSQEDNLLVQWELNPPLPSGETDGVILEVVFDEPAADGQRVVNRACISAEEPRKPRCAAAVVFVGNPRGDDGPAGPGFWCHALRFVLEDRHNAPVDAEDFIEWLIEIGLGSEVFHDEPYDASTPELARDLLCSPQSAESAADRLLRHLLTLWFNVVSGRIAMDQELNKLCDGDELMPEVVEPQTIMELIIEVEKALLAPDDDQTLAYWSEVVDAVNNSLLPGEPGCTAPLTTSGRRRAGHGNPGGKIAVTEN